MKLTLPLLTSILLVACGSSSDNTAIENQVGSLPLEIIEPITNASNQDKIALGKMLFWDPILSGNQDVACASCHHPDNAYAEHIDISIGVGGQGLSASRNFGTLAQRNAQTILNTAYNGIDALLNYDPDNTVMFWDSRASSLEEQALEPILSAAEMRGTVIAEEDILDVVNARIGDIPAYVQQFEDAFGTNEVNATRIAQAIAAFERSLLSNNSRFDRYARGDNNALSELELRGLAFFTNSGCNVCHSGPMFSDFDLHQLPVPQNDKLTNPDPGVNGQFRTPSLRNVAITAPYMHNGTIATLESAISFYDGIANPSGDPDLAQLDFEDDSVEAIAAFLKTLTDESFDKTIPDTVPSGLPVGGNI